MKNNWDETGLEIAIIGVAGKFPGAENINQFWDNLKKGIESVVFFHHKELSEEGVESNQLSNPNYVKTWGGFLDDIECFDADFFGYTPSEAELMNPQIRIFHECTWHALENAGYNPYSFKGDIGLFAGAASNISWESVALLSGKAGAIGNFATAILTDRDYLCTRTSYSLNLKGPSVVLKTACSTSLVAVHTACQSIINGECDMALAGGITITRFIKRGYLYQENSILSSDGHCRTFDSQATGTIGGDGVGIVLLKGLTEAIADRDHIYAIIKGSAINNDGFQKAGYTAPSVQGQVEVISNALQVAEVNPDTIKYVELHGTATAVGDPIEFEALNLAFNTNKKRFCALGSVKSNIGHLDCAAGIAGLIKTVMALKYQLIPPSLHINVPNLNIDIEDSPFYLNAKLSQWNRDHSPLRAGVSSFGIGGTNAHVILEEAPEIENSIDNDELKLICLSAKTPSALKHLSNNFLNFFKANQDVNLADVAYTLHAGRSSLPYRKAIVCSNINDLTDVLASNQPINQRIYRVKNENLPNIFMFPGIGSQYTNMGWDIYQKISYFQKEMDHCFKILKPLIGFNLKEILYPSLSNSSQFLKPSGREKLPIFKSNHNGDDADLYQPKIMQNTGGMNLQSPQKLITEEFQIAQLVVFILEYSLTRLLVNWGIKPSAMIGYSLGEYTSACISGVFSLEDALTILVARGKLISRIPLGAMLSVPLTKNKLKNYLNDELSVAIDNGPSCIVAGPIKTIDRFEEKLNKKKIMCMKLTNTYALHSNMMEPILQDFIGHMKKISLNKPQIPYISNVTGKWISVQEATDPNYWSLHLRKTVNFAEGIEELLKDNKGVFIEIGPGRDLCALVNRQKDLSPGVKAVNIIQPMQKNNPDDQYLLEKIGKLWQYGVDTNMQQFYLNENRYRIPLPNYPFEKHKYRFNKERYTDAVKFFHSNSKKIKKIDIADWFHIPQWYRSSIQPGTTSNEFNIRNCWLLFAGENGLSKCFLEHLKEKKQNIIIVKPGLKYRFTENIDQSNGILLYKIKINPREPHHYHKLFKNLKLKGHLPQYIIHLWNLMELSRNINKPMKYNLRDLSIECIEKTMDLGFYSILNVARAIGNNDIASEMTIGAITENMQPVTGEENLHPDKAIILSPIKIIPLEYSNIKCLSIDISDQDGDKQKIALTVKGIFNEFFSELKGHRIVAYRGTYRWLQQFQPIKLNKYSDPNKPNKIKNQGVYMITGAFGGIGFQLAKYLAETMKAKLILVDLFNFPVRDGYEQWLSSEERQNDIQSKIQELKKLEKKGAEIQIFNTDVSNYQQMKRVISNSIEHFHKIDGVIHCAGLIDYGGIIQRRSRETTETLLAAKIKGTIVIDKLLKNHQLNFTVFLSSNTNIFYNLNFGQVSYSAGHEFLDVYCDYKRQQGQNAITINCNTWDDIGMIARSLKFRNTQNAFYSTVPNQSKDIVLMSPSEGIDTFKRIVENDYCRVIIYPGDLNQKVESIENSKNGGAIDQNPASSSETEEENSNLLNNRQKLDSVYIKPSNIYENIISGIWETIFGIMPIGVVDDFFELGGDSLKASTMLSKLDSRLKMKIPLAEVYKRPTIQKLTEYIQSKQVYYEKTLDDNLILLKEGSKNSAHFFFIHAGVGEVGVYFELCNQLNCDFNFWGIKADMIENYTPSNITIKEVAENYVKKIRGVQPHGPYYIAGWCTGGVIAFEVVRQLEELNEIVGFLGLIEAPLPEHADEFEYTVETESELVFEHFTDPGIKKYIKGITSFNKFWTTVIDYVIDANLEIEKVRQIFPENAKRVYPNYDQLGIKDLVFYLNMARMFERAESLYLPGNNVNASSFVFNAIDSTTLPGREKWKKYCNQLVHTHWIKGDHYTIFSQDLTGFLEVFRNALNDVAECLNTKELKN